MNGLEVFGKFGPHSKKMIDDMMEITEKIEKGTFDLNWSPEGEMEMPEIFKQAFSYFDVVLQKEFLDMVSVVSIASEEPSAMNIHKLIQSVGTRTIQMVLEFTNLFIRSGFVFTFKEIMEISAKYYSEPIRKEIEAAIADPNWDWQSLDNEYQKNLVRASTIFKTMLNDVFGTYLDRSTDNDLEFVYVTN